MKTNPAFGGEEKGAERNILHQALHKSGTTTVKQTSRLISVDAFVNEGHEARRSPSSVHAIVSML